MIFNKPLADINENDLQTLIDNQISEGKTIEYKSMLPGNGDGDKKEFLADVSSFANAAGGDLVYGVKEEAGLPIEICGLEINDVDAEILRLESTIRDCLAPRLPRIEIHPVHLSLATQCIVIIIRVQKSYLSPHMVTFKKDSRFFTRNSRGKYQLDVSELRTAFVLSETLTERVRSFRIERLSRISSGEETPAPLNEQEPKLVLHLIPLNSFSSSISLDLKPLNDSFQGRILDKGTLLRPLLVWDIESDVAMRFNFDGIVRSNQWRNPPSTAAYAQVFRNGIIETVDLSILGVYGKKEFNPGEKVETRIFSGERYERKLVEAVKRYIDLQKFLGVEPPFFIMVSFLGVKGYKITHPNFKYDFSPYTNEIDRNNLIIPEIMVENFDTNLAVAMRQIFDTVWNATGYSSSPNYDKEGKFKFDY